MKKGRVIVQVMILALLLGTGCSRQQPEQRDSIVPPAGKAAAQLSGGIRPPGGGSSSLNGMSNMSPLGQPSNDMVYTMLDREGDPLSVFADNKYLYLLRSGKKAPDGGQGADRSEGVERYGNSIGIYDVENGSLVRKVEDKRLGTCSAFTVKDSNLFAFDAGSGRISIYSSGGSFLSFYETGLAGVYADKLAVADGRLLALKIHSDAGNGGKTEIAVVDPDSGSVKKYAADKMRRPSSGPVPDIVDFCLFGGNRILVTFSDGWLSLFDMEKGAPEKECLFPVKDGFIEFDGNVLYYAADGPLSLLPANTANFSNAAAPRQTGRLLINSEFDWPDSRQELEQSLLQGLQLPQEAMTGRHYAMAKNTKYLFFLDFLPASQEEGKKTGTGFLLYRIMK